MISNFQKFPHFTAAQVQQNPLTQPQQPAGFKVDQNKLGPPTNRVDQPPAPINRRPSALTNLAQKLGGGASSSGVPTQRPTGAYLNPSMAPTLQRPPGSQMLSMQPRMYDPGQEESSDQWSGNYASNGGPAATTDTETASNYMHQQSLLNLHKLAQAFRQNRKGISGMGFDVGMGAGEVYHGNPDDYYNTQGVQRTAATLGDNWHQPSDKSNNADSGQIIQPLTSQAPAGSQEPGYDVDQEAYDECMKYSNDPTYCRDQATVKPEDQQQHYYDNSSNTAGDGSQDAQDPRQYPWPSLKRAEGYMPGVGGINFEDPYLTDSGQVNSALEEAINAGNNDYWTAQQKAITNQILNQGNTAMSRLASAMAARGLGASGANLQGMAETSGATQNALGQALAQLSARRAQTDIARLGELGRLRHSLGNEALQRQGLQYGTQMQAAGLEADLQNQDYQQQMQDYYALLNAIQTVMNAKQQGAPHDSSLTWLANQLI